MSDMNLTNMASKYFSDLPVSNSQKSCSSDPIQFAEDLFPGQPLSGVSEPDGSISLYTADGELVAVIDKNGNLFAKIDDEILFYEAADAKAEKVEEEKKTEETCEAVPVKAQVCESKEDVFVPLDEQMSIPEYDSSQSTPNSAKIFGTAEDAMSGGKVCEPEDEECEEEVTEAKPSAPAPEAPMPDVIPMSDPTPAPEATETVDGKPVTEDKAAELAEPSVELEVEAEEGDGLEYSVTMSSSNDSDEIAADSTVESGGATEEPQVASSIPAVEAQADLANAQEVPTFKAAQVATPSVDPFIKQSIADGMVEGGTVLASDKDHCELGTDSCCVSGLTFMDSDRAANLRGNPGGIELPKIGIGELGQDVASPKISGGKKFIGAKDVGASAPLERGDLEDELDVGGVSLQGSKGDQPSIAGLGFMFGKVKESNDENYDIRLMDVRAASSGRAPGTPPFSSAQIFLSQGLKALREMLENAAPVAHKGYSGDENHKGDRDEGEQYEDDGEELAVGAMDEKKGSSKTNQSQYLS